MRTAVAALAVVLGCTAAFAQDLSTNFKGPITVPYDASLRPQTTYLPFNTINPGYGPIDIRVADNYTGNQPSQIHLGLSGTNSYWVMWATGTGKFGRGYLTPNNPFSVPSIVKYGYSADNLNFTQTGAAEIYDQIYLDALAAKAGFPFVATNYTSPILHNVNLNQLKPQTTYYYQVGDGTTFSTTYNFTTFVDVSKGAVYPQRLLLVADWGMAQNSTTTLYHLLDSLRESPSGTALLNFGDLSYADDQSPDGTYGQTGVYPTSAVWQYTGNEGTTSKTFQPVWDAWLRLIQPLIAQVPMLTGIGNHDVEQQHILSKFLVSYQARFKNAQRSSNSNSFQFYSVNVGPTHNIFLSSYIDYTTGSAQYNWLLNDLQSIDRSKTPWVIASNHHPLYSTDTSFKEYEQMRVMLEPLMYQYGVDVFYNGHVHSYERINPVYNYLNNICGTVHITIGDGGNNEGLSGLNYQASTNGAPALAHLYEDTLSGCPTRSTNTASINDATSISSANPRAYRPGPLTPLDANSASSLPLNSTFDPWSDPSTCHPFPAPAMPPCRQYYKLTPTFQGTGNGTGSGALQQAASPKGYCWQEQPPWSAYRESSFGHGTLDIVNATHALWHWIRNQDTEDGPIAVVTDPIYIFRNPICTNKQARPSQRSPRLPSVTVNAAIPTPTPSPTTPTPAAPANKLGNIVDSIAGLHKDVFGFQALDASQDTSGAVLPVTAETGVAGTDINSAPQVTGAAAPAAVLVSGGQDQGQDPRELPAAAPAGA
ncbi:g13538 [Coccomyxa viridis]|uniref:Purple acid phosphatase n=1 Tax=Coccomyxa viridis TaxID=1274662 RepID=A0ABP1GH62_9CHLO